MAETCGWVVAIKMEKRVENATRLQEVLTKHGCAIRARLGLHEASRDYCADYGVIILQVCGCCEEIGGMVADLNAVPGVTAKSLNLDD